MNTGENEWKIVIEAIPCLCWGVIIFSFLLVGISLFLKYIVKPRDKYRFEKELKEMAFEHEKEWDNRKKSKIPVQEKLDKLEKEIIDLKEAIYGKND